MDKKQIENKLKEAEDIVKECREQLSKINIKKDYSNFVGRFGDMLCIFGYKNMLKSFGDGSIYYDDECKEDCIGELNYEIVDGSELKYGDVVCFEPDYNVDELSYTDFGIYVGKDDIGDTIFQTLNIMGGVEVIDYMFLGEDYNFGKMVRFLRD